MNIQSIYSHSIGGVFYFNLPVALLLAALFHGAVRNILIQNTPSILSKHLASFTTFHWGNHVRQYWPAVVFSVIIGAFSHIMWDSFTHGPGQGVAFIPFLRQTVLQTASMRLPLYTVLQHLSSLVGLIYIFIFIKKLPANERYHSQIDLKYWLYIFLITTGILIFRCYIGWGCMFLGDVIVSAVSASLLALLLVSFIMGKKQAG